MSPDRQVEVKQTPSERNGELIIQRLSDYLAIRFEHAGRIDPHLLTISQDVSYHEMANVRRCLLGSKLYGTVRMTVSDVFVGDDNKKRRGLMSPTDQTSIQVEVVSHCQDERVEATRGQIRIHDLKTFYAAINPNLTDMMDLVETWIWWDILDSAELARFEQKLGIVAKIRQSGLPDPLRKRYALLIGNDTEDEQAAAAITAEDVLRYEFKQLVHIRDQWKYRRESDLGYMFVLKRDELPSANEGELIHRIAERVREYDQIKEMEELSDEVKHRYAPDLRMPPDRVTKDMVKDYVRGKLVESEREMLNSSGESMRLGPPYNYKKRQGLRMDKVLAEMAGQLKAILAEPAAEEPAAKK